MEYGYPFFIGLNVSNWTYEKLASWQIGVFEINLKGNVMQYIDQREKIEKEMLRVNGK